MTKIVAFEDWLFRNKRTKSGYSCSGTLFRVFVIGIEVCVGVYDDVVGTQQHSATDIKKYYYRREVVRD